MELAVFGVLLPLVIAGGMVLRRGLRDWQPPEANETKAGGEKKPPSTHSVARELRRDILYKMLENGYRPHEVYRHLPEFEELVVWGEVKRG